jgi:hypothetical protein
MEYHQFQVHHPELGPDLTPLAARKKKMTQRTLSTQVKKILQKVLITISPLSPQSLSGSLDQTEAPSLRAYPDTPYSRTFLGHH